MVSILVVEHEATCPIDRMGGWLGEAGAELVMCRPYAGDPVPVDLAEDGLLVLGGSMGALDDHPWLTPTRTLLARAVDQGRPTLGICLGAQLLAVACGGRVDVGLPGIEAGVVDARWRPEAHADPLVRGLPDPFPGPSMHQDAVVALPDGAAWLAETSMYPHQAFRVGRAGWGVQFHPEVSVTTFRRWGEGHLTDWGRWGIDGDGVVEQLVRRDGEVAAAGRALAARFAALVRADAVRRPVVVGARGPESVPV